MNTGNILNFKASRISDEEREARREALSTRRRVDNEKAELAIKNRPASGKKTRLNSDDAAQMASNLRSILNRVGKESWAKICEAAFKYEDRTSTKNLGRYIGKKGECSTAWANYVSLARKAALHYPPADGDEQFFLADLIRGTSFEPIESSIIYNSDTNGWAKELCRVLSRLERVLPSNIQNLLEKCHAAKLVATRPLYEKPQFFVSEDCFWHSMYFMTDEWIDDIDLPDSVNTIPVCLLGRSSDFDAYCRISYYTSVLDSEAIPPVDTASITMALEFSYVYPADNYPFIAIKLFGEMRIGGSRKNMRSIFRIDPTEDNIYKTTFCIVTDTGTDKDPICPEVFHCTLDTSNGFAPLLGLLEALPFIYKAYEGATGIEETFHARHDDLISGSKLVYFIGNSYYCELLNAENCLKYFSLSAAGQHPDYSLSSNEIVPQLLPPAGSVAAHIIDNLRQPENSDRYDQQLIVQCNHIEDEVQRLTNIIYQKYENDLRWLLEK